MSNLKLSKHSLSQLSETYNCMVENIYLLDNSFKNKKIVRFRSKAEAIERIVSLWAVFNMKYIALMSYDSKTKDSYFSGTLHPHETDIKSGTPIEPMKYKPQPISQEELDVVEQARQIVENAKNNTIPYTRGHSKMLRGRKEEVLELLRVHPRFMSELAKELDVTKRNISTLLTYLRREGYNISVTRVDKYNYVVQLLSARVAA